MVPVTAPPGRAAPIRPRAGADGHTAVGWGITAAPVEAMYSHRHNHHRSAKPAMHSWQTAGREPEAACYVSASQLHRHQGHRLTRSACHDSRTTCQACLDHQIYPRTTGEDQNMVGNATSSRCSHNYTFYSTEGFQQCSGISLEILADRLTSYGTL